MYEKEQWIRKHMIIKAKTVYVNSSKCSAWIMYLLFSLYSCTNSHTHTKEQRDYITFWRPHSQWMVDLNPGSLIP